MISIRSARDTNLNKELNLLFNDLIKTREKELSKMSQMREKLFGKLDQEKKDISNISEDLSQELRQMEADMQTMFNRLRNRVNNSSSMPSNPKVEIKEDERSYDIKAEVPGIAKDNIKVQVVDNNLVIQGQRLQEVKREEKATTSSEFDYGEFKRSIPLDKKVDTSSLKVEYREGILMVHLNKV